MSKMWRKYYIYKNNLNEDTIEKLMEIKDFMEIINNSNNIRMIKLKIR